MRGLLLAASVLTLSTVVGCKRAKQESSEGILTFTVSTSPGPAPKLEPLLEWRDVETFEVPDWGNAVAWIPVGATSRRPIVLGVHGNSETPEEFCEMLHGIVRSRAFTLCPRGVKPPNERNYPGYTFLSVQTLALEVDAAIKELDRHYPGYVYADSILYVGFSRGAFLSVGIIATEPARYAHAILIEGGQDAWTPDRVNMYGAEGGSRILFACGQEECMYEAQRVADKLELVGVETHVAYRAPVGHVYTGVVAEELKKGFDWVIANDPKWK